MIDTLETLKEDVQRLDSAVKAAAASLGKTRTRVQLGFRDDRVWHR
jgi:hypothetical protein